MRAPFPVEADRPPRATAGVFLSRPGESAPVDTASRRRLLQQARLAVARSAVRAPGRQAARLPTWTTTSRLSAEARLLHRPGGPQVDGPRGRCPVGCGAARRRSSSGTRIRRDACSAPPRPALSKRAARAAAHQSNSDRTEPRTRALAQKHAPGTARGNDRFHRRSATQRACALATTRSSAPRCPRPLPRRGRRRASVATDCCSTPDMEGRLSSMKGRVMSRGGRPFLMLGGGVAVVMVGMFGR